MTFIFTESDCSLLLPQTLCLARQKRPKLNSWILPALRETFVNLFYGCAWEIGIEKWRLFCYIFSGVRFARHKARKILKQFGEHSEQNPVRNLGRIVETFGELFVLHLF